MASWFLYDYGYQYYNKFHAFEQNVVDWSNGSNTFIFLIRVQNQIIPNL